MESTVENQNLDSKLESPVQEEDDEKNLSSKLEGSVEDENSEEEELSEEEIQKRVGEAEESKAKGNMFFKNLEFVEAAQCYSASLDIAPKKHKNRAIYYANRAACWLQTNDYEAVVKDTTRALVIDPGYIKALHRRGAANKCLEHYRLALEDYKKVVELDPSNTVAQQEVSQLPPLVAQKEEEEKERMMNELKGLGNKFLGMFGMSLDNFKAEKDPATGQYSINFQNN